MTTICFKNELVNSQDDLMRFANHLTADRDEANDLVQETILRALDNQDKFTNDTNFKGWMRTIMRNLFINNYRRVARDQSLNDENKNLFWQNLRDEDAQEESANIYDLKEIHRILGELPHELRVPFLMYVSGFKYREIADKLGLPLGTVKSRIFFSRQRLQRDLKDFR